MINKQKYVRKPLFVEAVRVTAANFEEVTAWCQGEIEQDITANGHPPGKKYIKVRVHNPKNPRQTKAFVGDWLLYTERGYKVYTSKAFHASFDPVIEDSTPPALFTTEVLEDKPDILTEVHQAIAEDNPMMAGYAESLEMRQAIETIEAEGGTVEEATPEAIADAVTQNEQARVEYPETHTIGGTPRDEINVGTPVEVEGKRVLSLEDQEQMDQDEIRELLKTGEVILAQDLAA